MQVSEDISLREYLHLLERRIKDPPCLDRYDEFLIKVWEFFALRAAAEDNYSRNLHLAYSKHGALPISWEQIRDTWNRSGPPEQIITRIAKKHFNDVNMLLGNMRKVLNRVRQKVALGRVQQVDSHCLRWLTRQPGLTPAEKGGARQEILGVVRVENYNTLENRVLKDFLWRCLGLTTMYLRRYAEQFPQHATIKVVAHFRNLCVMGLSAETMKGVLNLHEMPQPNYVLQQDKLYSKVWNAYTTILRQEDVAERLWAQRKDVDDLYQRCVDGVELHCSPRARYRTPLWINELDGRQPIFEEPIWENVLTESKIDEPSPPNESTAIINFTFPWDARAELVYPSNHKNARPFLQNHHRPNLEPGQVVSLNEILRKKDGHGLSDYFRQLYELVGGKRWIVLVPDNWEPEWLETVIRARPPALSSKESVFLLWRSVAVALGVMNDRMFSSRQHLIVADGYRVPSYNAVCIRFMKELHSGRVLPQRASTRLHSALNASCADMRFVLDASYSNQAAAFSIGGRTCAHIGSGMLSQVNFVAANAEFSYADKDDLLYTGVRRFLKEEALGLVSYFDERDELSLVVQNRAEEVEFLTLVDHDECSPGGRPYVGKKTRGGALQAGVNRLSLNLLEGDQCDDAPLKEMVVELEEICETTADIFFEAQMTPGQGLASVMFSADFLKKPLPLDLTKLCLSDNTKSRIEREMKRHFPPVMPFVEASNDIWQAVKFEANRYLSRGILPSETGLFYKPQPYWGKVDPLGQLSFRLYGEDRFFDEEKMSPIDLLKRENVFGNAPGHEFPTDDFDWGRLFSRLAMDYRRGRDVLRMIAWTYQYRNEEFEFIRRSLYSQYVGNAQPLSIVEYTFCANCYGTGDKRIAGMLSHVLKRIAGGVALENEYRLTYNLLQFHPEAVEGVDSELCERAFMRVYREYNTYPFLNKWGNMASAQATKMAGYFLKCMLFLLHRRRYDPSFLKRSEDWQPQGFLAEAIPARTPTQEGHEKMRVSFLNYVRGHGTIEGIPLGD